jgi:phenylacetate-CoA oxygenase PaaH subunit
MADTQWPVYEVFLQEKRGDPHVHVGAVHAPDPEMALILAKEQFARRGRCASLWVVPRGSDLRFPGPRRRRSCSPPLWRKSIGSPGASG